MKIGAQLHLPAIASRPRAKNLHLSLQTLVVTNRQQQCVVGLMRAHETLGIVQEEDVHRAPIVYCSAFPSRETLTLFLSQWPKRKRVIV